MVLTCKHCKYTFEVLKWDKQCRDCGEFSVRKATQSDINEYRRGWAELDAGLADWCGEKYANR